MKFQEIVKENFMRGDEKRVLLSEVKLSRILKHHGDNGFVIISAERKERKPEENKEKNLELRQDIIKSGFNYIPVYGGYIENKGMKDETVREEKAFFVPAKKGSLESMDELKKLGMEWTKKYNQESFFFSKPGNKPAYITPDGGVDMEFNGMTLNDAAQDYFTRFNKSKNKTDRRITYTFEGVYMNDAPSCMSEACTRYGELFITKESE